MTAETTVSTRGARQRGAPRRGRMFRRLALLPAVVVLLLLTVVPVLNLFAMALSEITFSRGSVSWTFAPMKNLQTLAADGLFRIATLNTVIFVVASVSIEMLFGTTLAVLAASMRRGKGIIRTVTILPILVSAVAIGAMWRLMYSYDFGLFNQILGVLGVGKVGWLSDASIALFSVVIVDIWHWTPLVFLILFAAAEGLPRDVIEAARIDGATRWQLLRYVILPLLGPAIAVAFIFRSIAAFKVFDQIVLLTGGGPGSSTEVLSLRLYRVFFEQNALGYGALLSVLTIAMILAFLLTARLATRRREEADA